MPLFKSSQEWLEQSTLLIEARPKTTRITTRYSIKVVPARIRPATGTTTTTAENTTTTTEKTSDADTAGTTVSKPPRGSLVLTTYDPVTGVNLKYRTTKAAEVTRLVQVALARLGRCMAGLPAECPDEPMPDAPPVSSSAVELDGKRGSGAGTPVQQGGQAPPSAGGRKKKKGRK
ncbi:hypothetical protein E4U43_003178 [Claviceps pusilla]|uniref:SRP9 domain-containing protein n=1 Tax=Claviceps pusilla TaxID=123648 RepID=A0A9P7NGJ4_9HYPO|nr:hypothetical protein E4U43_003178 [Claviceps pusilla]